MRLDYVFLFLDGEYTNPDDIKHIFWKLHETFTSKYGWSTYFLQGPASEMEVEFNKLDFNLENSVEVFWIAGESKITISASTRRPSLGNRDFTIIYQRKY